MVTNGTIDIYEKNKTWKHADDPTFIGTYDVWINEETQLVYKALPGAGGENPQLMKVGKGLVFLFEEVDLDNCFFTYKDKQYEILSVETWRPSADTFGHMEVIYE